MHALVAHMASEARCLAGGGGGGSRSGSGGEGGAEGFVLDARRVLCAAVSRARKAAVASGSPLGRHVSRALHAARVVRSFVC
jgi:hypothetical protein